jgi:hypothetical protein
MGMNDPAYPSYFFPEQYNPEFGLTKRELIAAMAMQGMLSNPNVRLKPNTISKWAVNHADALIERLAADPVAEGVNLLPMYSRELDEGMTDGK